MQRVVQTAQSGARRDVVQPMPPLSSEQLEALREDIAEHGVLVPITVDQHGRVIDGNNRAAIAAELGIDCPRTQIEVADDDAAFDLAVTLNCARRHLTREQVRELIHAEIARRPDDSDRAISRRVGCSPSTVGSVRKSGDEVSNLDTPTVTREEAEASVAAMQQSLKEARAALYSLVRMALVNHISVHEVIGALTMARLKFNARRDRDPEARKFFSEQVYDYVIEVTSWDVTAEQFPPHPDANPTPTERAMLIDNIVSMGVEHHPADLVDAE